MWGEHGKTARFSAKYVRQWDVVFNLFSISFVAFRLSWSQLHFFYILYNPAPPPPTAPPGRPENLAFPSIGPYSVTVTWDPPSDDGGSPDLLNYMIALTTTSDGQSVSVNQTTQTQLTFAALSHSENYTVSVVAINSLGQQGPSAVGTFRTRDIRE